jgi:GNAT superfamily N-acetyltransferase
VVEKAGKPVASLGVVRVTHFEGLWIDPAHRNAGVSSALIRKAIEQAREMSKQDFVFGGAADERMRTILERLGGQRMPLDFYALWIGGQHA